MTDSNAQATGSTPFATGSTPFATDSRSPATESDTTVLIWRMRTIVGTCTGNLDSLGLALGLEQRAKVRFSTLEARKQIITRKPLYSLNLAAADEPTTPQSSLHLPLVHNQNTCLHRETSTFPQALLVHWANISRLCCRKINADT